MIIKRVSALVLCLATAWLTLACTSPEERAATYLAEAQQFFDEGDTTKAMLDVRNAIQIEPNNADARILLAKILEEDGDFQGVFENLRIAVDVDPTKVEARIQLGSLYAAARMFPEAQIEVDAALSQAPDNLDAQILSARLFAQAGQFEQAELVLRDVLERDPANNDALLLLVGISVNQDPEAALVLLDEGMENAEDTRALRILRIEILQRLDRGSEIEPEYRALIDDHPDDNAFRFRLAQYLLSQGRVDDVEQLLRDIVDTDPGDASTRLALVQFLANVRGQEVAEQTLLQFVNDLPENYELQLALARLYEATDNLDMARQTYTNIAAAAENDDIGLTARNQLARMLIQDGNVDEGREYINEILAVDSTNIEALMMHGGLALVDGEYRDAINDFRNVLRKEPSQERAHYLLARTHLQAGDRVLAKDAYRRVLELNPDNGIATMELAQILFADQQFAAAESLLRSRLLVAPGDVRASQMLIGLLVNDNQYVNAEAEARRLLSVTDESAMADYLLGSVLQIQGKSEPAMEYLTKALDKAPESPEALQGYVTGLKETQGQVAAERYLKAHVEKYPEQLHAIALLSQVQAGLGDTQGAGQTLQAALEKNEAWLPAYTGLASMQAGDISKQIEIFEEGMQAIPGNQQLGLLLGTAYEREGRIDDAIEMYEALLAQNPDLPAVVNNLAALIADFRQDPASLKRAMTLVEEQKMAETENPAFLDTVGWLHYRLGNYKEALPYLQQAVAAAGQVPVLRYHLGMAYLALGNKAGAQEELSIAVSKATSDFTGIEDARSTLENINNP